MIIINKYDAAALIGLVFLFGIAKEVSVPCFCVILACFIFIYSGFLRLSKQTAKTAVNDMPEENTAADILPKPRDGADTADTAEENMAYKCSVQRTGLSQSVAPGAIYIGKSPDQTARRKVPVRSYRTDEMALKGKFAIIIDMGPADDAVRTETEKNINEKTVPTDCGKKTGTTSGDCPDKTAAPCYADFPEEGYIDPGLPEI